MSLYPYKMTPQEYCEKKTKESHSSFLSAFIFLNKRKRNALTALYAFCREVDDIVDESDEYKIRNNKLNWWREEISRLYERNPQHPVTKELAIYIDEFHLSKAYFDEIIDGMEMDLNFNRYKNFKQLQLYCYRVASCVGILSAHIFGFKDAKTLKYAHNLGIALQLTNIIRDIGEDAKRGRIYIPLDELKKSNLSEADILNFKQSIKIKNLIEWQAERAKYFYQLAVSDLPYTDRRSQKPGLVMANIYYVLLTKITKDHPENTLNQKVLISRYKKIQITLLTFINFNFIKMY